MKTAGVALLMSLASAAALAQRPSDPALLVAQDAPAMDYVAVADPLTFPPGITMGPAASVAFDSKGHLWVLNRGEQPLVEFDATGKLHQVVWAGSLYSNTWVEDRPRRKSLDHRRRRSHRRQDEPARASVVNAWVPKVSRAIGTRPGIASAEPAERRGDRPQRRDLRRPGTHSRPEWRPSRLEVRQERQLHQVLGREGEGARQVRSGSRDRN